MADTLDRGSVERVLARRRSERQRLIGLAREYVDRLSRRLPLEAVAVVGSVARGDFNVWSDIDVVVVAEGLPERSPDRSAMLAQEVPPGVQPVGFTPVELASERARRNPLIREMLDRGVFLTGEDYARELLGEDAQPDR